MPSPDPILPRHYLDVDDSSLYFTLSQVLVSHGQLRTAPPRCPMYGSDSRGLLLLPPLSNFFFFYKPSHLLSRASTVFLLQSPLNTLSKICLVSIPYEALFHSQVGPADLRGQ